ncbi:PF04134 family protein [Leptospira broomii serovar Hurstbridge str. 5399]|uniref:PF04134 family protein n=1 Tax=Leptospira broomii serovar Hurstbridge str. 5399 TaxID=1049789 RepID=T0GDS2_9LEPT|nr:DCC1-like thiol-disulfide oxidoreductase family protein [Leptospira broomii]EQA44969.1 PF04134 family protein [Leptospira broomii serovar Hurstbridge str. 5399]
MNEKIFLYDGECEFCADLAGSLKDKCLDSSVHFQSFRTLKKDELQKIHPSLTIDVAAGNVQFVEGNTRYPGFFAVRRLSHSLSGWRWAAPLLYFPFVPILGILFMNLLKAFRKKGNNS